MGEEDRGKSEETPVFKAQKGGGYWRPSIRFDHETGWYPGCEQSAPRAEAINACAAYKRKAQKVNPVDHDQSDGSKPDGRKDWKERCIEAEAKRPPQPRGPFDQWITPKFSDIPRGSRLTQERCDQLQIGKMVTQEEKTLIIEMLFNREAALSWDFSEIGLLKDEVMPPAMIRTVPHTAWQTPSFPIPKSLTGTVAQMLQERVDAGLLEECHGPYRNPYFLVKKKETNKYRIVNAAMEINRVTIRDANLPPNPDDFAESFAGLTCASLVDFFSGYDQIGLAEESRDLTGFHTPLGLLRMTRLPQGGTNSVAQFVRVVTRILHDHFGIAMPFVDDVGVKGPKSRYNDQEVAPGIRRFVLEHIQNLDRCLCDIERSGCTIAGGKSQFCMSGIKIVGYVCDADGRHPDTAKVIKILQWKTPTDRSEVRGFLGVCVYYRIWILDFAIVAAPLYRLLKNDVPFIWQDDQQRSMEALQKALTSAPALVAIDYSPEGGTIIVGVDASLVGWGGTLSQAEKGNDKRRHPVRYESGMWDDREQQYDAGKRECRAVMKILKKLRSYIYGIHFVLEIDPTTLVAQLNRPSSDLPGSVMARWVAWIRLFDFEVRHVAGTKHTAADSLSRRPFTEDDIAERAKEKDIDDQIDIDLFTVSVPEDQVDLFHVSLPAEDSDLQGGGGNDQTNPTDDHPLREGYSAESQELARYLMTLEKPGWMSRKEFRSLKGKALQFQIVEGHLYKRSQNGSPLRRVVDGADDQKLIVRKLHEESGHKGIEATFRKLIDRYFWSDAYRQVVSLVKSCGVCQRRNKSRVTGELHPTYGATLFENWSIDVVYMPLRSGKAYLIVAREHLSGWVEARAIAKADSPTVARFLYEDIVTRHGPFKRLITDGGPENKDWVDSLCNYYDMKHITVSAYHPEANGMIERGHQPIIDALSKLTGGHQRSWVPYLHAVLWADRVTVRRSTNQSPAFLVYGQEAILPIELELTSWRTYDWGRVRTTTELLAARAEQLVRRDLNAEEAGLYQRRMREKNKEHFDRIKGVSFEQLEEGQVVLVHDTKRRPIREDKLAFKWIGPYRIAKVTQDTGTYRLETMDGIPVQGTYTRNRLKLWIGVEAEEGDSELPIIGVQEDESDQEEDTLFPSMISPESEYRRVLRSQARQVEEEKLPEGGRSDSLPRRVVDKVLIRHPEGFDRTLYAKGE